MSTPETKKEDDKKEELNDEGNDNNYEIYLIILIPNEEKIDFQGLSYRAKPKIDPKIIFKNRIEIGDNTYLEELVFMFRRKKKKKEKENESSKSTKYEITFFENEHIYNIKFSSKNECFIYQPKLEIGNKFLDIIPEPIPQNIIPLCTKLDIFLEALKQTKDINQKEEKLYKDTIDLYKNKKQFSLLITLFLKIYEKNKELCGQLIEIFYKNNDDENNDKIDDLKKNLKSFKDIFSNARDILDESNYNPIHFYGILFCYLHFYEEKNFPKIVEEFSVGNAKILYEILIHYYSHFINPLKQNQKFYDDFIQYVLEENKEIKEFKKIINYIEDIETYLFVINKHKETIFKKYKELRSEPLEMDASLKLLKHKKDKAEKSATNEKEINELEISDEDDEKGLEEADNIENECHVIIKLIESIIGFSEREKTLAIYMRRTFWINLLEQYDIPDWENISNCHKLRELYKKYDNLVNILYEKSDIKNDINEFFSRDQFAIILNKLIKEFLEKKQKSLTNAEKLGCVRKFNPYFNIIDERDKNKYINNRETYIFDYVNFSKITPAFIKSFHIFNFEKVFENMIIQYINKITEKIKDIQTFGNIIKLIDEKRMKEENQKDYFLILEKKYCSVIKYNIKLIKDDKELKNSVKIIAEFVSKIDLFYENTLFLEKEIGSLEDNVRSPIYLELITEYSEEKYKPQKEFIYNEHLKTNEIITKEGRDKVIKLVKNLKDNDRNYFIYEKLLKACHFTEDEFFSNHENYKIQQLCLLKEELDKESQSKKVKELDIIKQRENGNENAKNLEGVLNEINEELERGKITKRDLERFLNIKKVQKNVINGTKKEKELKNMNAIENDKSDKYPKQKLGLIALIMIGKNYDPKEKYLEYKNIIDGINQKVENLILIKDSLMIFHRNKYINDIREIAKILDETENKPIVNFKEDKWIKSIDELYNRHKDLCKKINEVKDFLLFQKIFDNAQGKDQEARFNDAYNKLGDLKILFGKNPENIEVIFNAKPFEKIFKDIKEELGRKDEKKSDEFLEQMKKNFNIMNEKVIKDLKMLINSKKYEMIVKSIDYFFWNFLNKDLNLPEESKKLSEQPLDKLNSFLLELNKKKYYDYESNNIYYRVFTSIYEKKEAMDFLIRKINEAPEPKYFENLNDKKLQKKFEKLSEKLQNNLDPTNRSITIDDIDDTIDCLKHVNLLLDKKIPDIIKYLSSLDEPEIKKFESFSKKYASIIALDMKSGGDSFKEVYDIIENATLLFHLDSEDIKINGDRKKNIDELIKLGNKINIQYQGEKKEKNIFELKCDKLLFFKDIVSKIEIIYDKIDILRIKGYNIPIEINIEIKYPNVTYNLYGKPKDFNYIAEYLFKIKNDYETQLSTIYESNKYLRFLYGKFFRRVCQHQKGHCEIFEIIRYILNKTKVNKDKNTIQDTNEKHSPYIGEDYETEYYDYTNIIFQSISEYIIDLFKKNELNFQKHYENMIIKEEYMKKGISMIKCKEEQSIEENILCLFANKLDKLPIAQNILICSRETTIEEIQSFFYRAILCEFNTLFVLEILDSFSNFQQNKMFSYIDKLTSIKIEKKKKEK